MGDNRFGSRIGGALLATALTVTLASASTPSQAATTQTQQEASVQLRAGGNPDAYSFLGKTNGVPNHWDKCKRITYRVNVARAPKAAVRQVKEAARRLNGASGLRLHYDGTTKAKPLPRGDYPKGVEMIIGWLRPNQSPQMSSKNAGYGGVLWYGSGEIFKGYVQLNSKMNGMFKNGFGLGYNRPDKYVGTKGQLLMHEMGHAVGLDHVKDPHQVMYPQVTRKRAVYGAGDVNGLKRVGKLRRCF